MPSLMTSIGKRAIAQSPALTLILGYLGLAFLAMAAAPLLAYFSMGGQPLLLSEQVLQLYLPYLSGVAYLACGVWVYMQRSHDRTARHFVIFAISAGLVLAFAMPVAGSLGWYLTGNLAAALCAGALIGLFFTFPQEGELTHRFPALRWVGYLAALLLFCLALPASLGGYPGTNPNLLWTAGLALAAFLGRVALYRFTSTSPIIREQARLILFGAFVAYLPALVWFLFSLASPGWTFNSLFLLPFCLFPLAAGYAIVRYPILKTDTLARRAALYALLSVVTGGAYAIITTGLSLVFGPGFASRYPFLFGVIIFLMALLVLPLRSLAQRWIDELFSRGQSAYREQIESFSSELTKVVDLPQTITLLRNYCQASLRPTNLHIFIYDSLTDHYLPTVGEDGNPTTDLRFSATSPLVGMLSQRRAPAFWGEANTIPSVLQPEKARMTLLGALLFIALPGRGQLIGFVALGPRRSNETYTEQDLRFVEALCGQSALAIERTQVVANLERRMHQMNVLMRVSQGINITISFDDILELIYAQTNQLVSTVDFRITLQDRYSHYLYHVFFLDRDERLAEMENIPIPIGQGLEQEVVESRRAIATDDYERECRTRGVLPTATGILAWAGVPLNAGAETIGVMSLGSRDPSVILTDEQINLLQAIADQAAGAIIKARLLQESERRAKQLASLNEVARSLTSTLELERLLTQILYSAVEILNCEAGSLLMVDDESDEFVFQVVTGPVAGELVGTRMPKDTGLAGEAYLSRQPIVANDVRRTKMWFDQTDQQTGFTTKDMLVVPMLVKENVIGVIEVINKKDGLPFTQDDQDLLAAFASQAAVAIENARLYTMTDQALANRVEELSVMQRIDRELNASLDTARAMRITLGWAMRQSVADAGWIGVVEENGVRLMASEGYTTELDPYNEALFPLDFPSLSEAIEKGQPQWRQGLAGTNLGLLKNTRIQAAIPLRREAKTIGLILLESTNREAWPNESQEFISRLSDHAAIAIANAQLYAEVQAANLAKSDFVSFVSHELKTPMTSIKGFSDLLAAGVVGPINDNQANFLNTIRSNIDRMVTLVSDLADVSRIEAGRLRLEFSAVPVNEIVDEVVRSIQSQMAEKKQEMQLEVGDSLSKMWGDRTRLIQVLTNLVSNAVKYSPQDSKVVLRAVETANQWDAAGAPRVIHLSVEDHGFGISLEDQKKIFQKFFRSENQKIRDVPGTGLGLNITRTLVEMQGGKIWFESTLGQGTTFHFTVPIIESA